MASITRFLSERLKLTVNGAKSAVDRPWHRSFLGFSMTAHKEPRLRVAPKSVARFKGKLKDTAAARTWTQPCTHRQGPHARRARLDRILPTGRGEGHLRGTRRMDAAQTALRPVAAMETATERAPGG